jgi:hypothetical protein
VADGDASESSDASGESDSSSEAPPDSAALADGESEALGEVVIDGLGSGDAGALWLGCGEPPNWVGSSLASCPLATTANTATTTVATISATRPRWLENVAASNASTP